MEIENTFLMNVAGCITNTSVTSFYKQVDIGFNPDAMRIKNVCFNSFKINDPNNYTVTCSLTGDPLFIVPGFFSFSAGGQGIIGFHSNGANIELSGQPLPKQIQFTVYGLSSTAPLRNETIPDLIGTTLTYSVIQTVNFSFMMEFVKYKNI